VMSNFLKSFCVQTTFQHEQREWYICGDTIWECFQDHMQQSEFLILNLYSRSTSHSESDSSAECSAVFITLAFYDRDLLP